MLAVRALIAGLCLAAATAIVALLAGSFDDTHWRVIATSLGFSLFSAFAAAGDALRRGALGWRSALGAATAAASVAGFALLTLAVWFDDDAEGLWQAFGAVGLLALCGSHASLVLRAQRRDDTDLISALVWTSVATATFDTLVGVAAILGAAEDVGDAFARVVAVALVVMVLATAVPPLLRRAAGVPARPRHDAFGRPAAPGAAAVRRAGQADIGAVLDVWAQARSAAASMPDDAASVERLLARSPDALLVAEADGRVVGALVAAWDGWRGNLYRLAVLPSHRRRGIARRLVDAGHEHLRAQGARRVTALVAGEEAASALWRAAGYRHDEQIARYVRDL